MWAVWGFSGPVRSQAPALPGYVRDVVGSPRDSRALLIDRAPDGSVHWNVVDQRQPRWGSGEHHPAGTFHDELYSVVQAVVASAVPDDLGDQLRSLGVSHVWLRGFGPDERASLDNAAGLTSAASDDNSVAFTVVGLVSRSQVVGAGGAEPLLRGEVAAGAADRRLVVAEPADADWVATLNGRSLERTEVEGRLAFELGGEAGVVSVRPATHQAQFWLHLAVMLGLAVLAAPTMASAGSARRGQE